MRILLTYKRMGLDKFITVLATTSINNFLWDFISTGDMVKLIKFVEAQAIPEFVRRDFYLVGVSDVDFKSPRPTYRIDYDNF